MKIGFLFVLYILALSSYSQTADKNWVDKIESGRNHLKEKRLEAAMDNFNSALEYAIQEIGGDSPQVGTSYYFLGKTQARLSNDGEAIEMQRLALENMLQNDLHQHEYYYEVFEELIPIFKKYNQFFLMEAAMVNSITIVKSDKLTPKQEKEIVRLITKGFFLHMDSMAESDEFYWQAWHAFRDIALEDNSNLLEKIEILISTQPSYFTQLAHESPYEDLQIWKDLTKKYGKEFILRRKLEEYKLLESNFGPQNGAAMYDFRSMDRTGLLAERILNDLGNSHPLYIETQNFIGKVLTRLADYTNAHKYLEEAFLIMQDNRNISYEVYPELLTNYGAILVKLGKYENAEKLLLKTIKKLKERKFVGNKIYKIRNENNLNRARLELGVYYQEIGDSKNAEEVFKKALFSQDSLIKPSKGLFHDATYNEYVYEVSEELNNSYQLYKKIGNELLNLFLETSQSEGVTVNLSSDKESCYWHLLYYDKIDLRLYISCPGDGHGGSPMWSLGINKNDQDFNNSIFKFSLNNSVEHLQLYSNYLKNALFDYPPSIKPFVISIGDERSSRERREKKTAKDTLGDLRYGNYLKDFANIAFLGEDYSEAISRYEHYKKILDFNYRTDHRDYALLYKRLALANLKLKNLKEASDYLKKSNHNLLGQIDDVFRFGNVNEKKNFIKKLTSNFSDFQEIERAYPNLPDITEMNFDNLLVLKGLLLNSSKDILNDLQSMEEASINSLVGTYRSTRELLAAQYAVSRPLRTMNTDSLENIKQDIERQLVKTYTKNFGPTIDTGQGWKDLKNNLGRKEIAIEFSNFRVSDSRDKTIIYNAYLIHRKWDEPIMIPLFEESDLKRLISGTSPNSLYKSRGSTATNTQDLDGLYQLIWEKIDPYLAGVKNIYFSPSGLLNQVSFAALQGSRAEILASEYNLIQVNSTTSLLKNQSEPKTRSTLLIGGVNFDSTVESLGKESIENRLLRQKEISRSKSNNEIGTAWSYLPGTLAEVNEINRIFKEKNISSTLLTSNEATEENFIALSGRSSNIIHIATHGYFFENLEENDQVSISSSSNVFKSSEDPLLRSGLLFAGANYSWQSGNTYPQKEDGILTALEISNLDLSNTNMVVLSACETGLGDIDGSEGVYGLQRAFKMAGVDIILMSLWEVPDKETAEFMSYFYYKWINGNDVRKAFRLTQKYMFQKYKDAPENWAAFVMVE